MGSPLLNLPAEIRAQIWSYAFGHQKIHMSAQEIKLCKRECQRHNPCPRSTKWSFYQCFLRDAAHNRRGHCYGCTVKNCPRSSSSQSNDTSSCLRACHEAFQHRPCYQLSHGGVYLYDNRCNGADDLIMGKEWNDALEAITLPIGLCKALHSEIMHTIYATNTFIFESAESLQLFLNARALYQRQLIRNIELSLEYLTPRARLCLTKEEQVMKVFGTLTAPTSRFTGLKSLKIRLHKKSLGGIRPHYIESLIQKSHEGTMACFGMLAKLSGWKDLSVQVNCSGTHIEDQCHCSLTDNKDTLRLTYLLKAARLGFEPSEEEFQAEFEERKVEAKKGTSCEMISGGVSLATGRIC